MMMRIPAFKKFGGNDAVRNCLLGAGCAVGVSSVFGAPIGGVLFSIEVCSVHYQVHNLWYAMFPAIFAAIVVSLFQNSEQIVSLFQGTPISVVLC